MKNQIYILKPTVESSLYSFIESLPLDDKQKNCCYLIAYHFYKEYILDTDESKFVNREYPASSQFFDQLIGSSNWRIIKDLIVWNDRKDGSLNRELKIIYTNGSYIGDIEGKESRPLNYSLNKKYITADEWQEVVIEKTYQPRKSKNNQFITSLDKDIWNEDLAEEYRLRFECLTMDSQKANELAQRTNLKYSKKFTDVVTCEIKNFENEANRVTRSDKVHRLYSKVTNMKSELRYPILWDKEPTIILDMKSCSAYLMYPLISDTLEKDKWISWLKLGFYENIAATLKITKQEAKDVFTVWQGGVWDKGNARTFDELIQLEFPILHALISKKRAGFPKLLSYYSQRKDAMIIVDRIVLNPDAGFLSISIHDAILIKEKDKDLALETIIKTVEEHIGLTPVVLVEDPLEDLPELPKTRIKYKVPKVKETKDRECLDALLASLSLE